MAFRFADALDRSAETIKRPPPLPMGNYAFRVTKMPDPPEEIDTKVGKMEVLRIQAACVANIDADADEVAAFGNVAGVPGRVDFLFSNEDANKYEQTLNRFKTFCTSCGINTEAGTPGEWLRELPNAQFMAEITHRLDPNDSDITYSEIRATAPL